MKKKIGLVFDVLTLVIGLGLIIANIVHVVLYGNLVSFPVLFGGILLSGYGLYGIIKYRRSKQSVILS